MKHEMRYSQVPNKRGGPNNQGGWKNFQNLRNGGGVGILETSRMVIQQRKEQKQAVIKGKAKIYTEAR